MQYRNKFKIITIGSFLFLVAACKKDFLNREPLDTLSTDNSLATTNELRLFVNQFYIGSFPGQPGGVGGAGIAFNDAGTDNMTFSSVSNRMNGTLAVSNAAALTGYTTIRSINYFLENYHHATGDATLINNYLGEAKFFRAITYFNMVRSYGDLTWVNKVLPADTLLMQAPRDSRTLIIDSVLADLDQAVALLPVSTNSATMRLHRDVALAFKSRVALYEATWQKYHKAKNDPFFTKGITDAKIQNYFEQARDASLAVMNSNRWRIYSTGKPLEDYFNLFVTLDLSTNPEVLLWRKYSVADNIGHSVSKYTSTAGADMGINLSLVDDYLTKDGRPFPGNERAQAQQVYGNELKPDIRDPRLSQTVAVPGKPIRPGGVVPAYPPINQTGFNRSTTGYPLYKFLEFNDPRAVFDDFNSQCPAIAFRYAEVLLNYAEAMAELGGDPALIANALKPLRDRAGMPAVNFVREYNTDPGYPFNNLSAVLQAVRRERRIELAAEGFRQDDIMRWAAADVLIVNKRPLGALFIGSDMQANYPSSFQPLLTGNTGDTRRYLDPLKNVVPNGYGFNVNRDYLLPIQQRMLQLTANKWVQNPGW
ncbi:MAG: RagB/SusD family nutrient uptake outer membrane protein [Chitinophagaceae bacterium]